VDVNVDVIVNVNVNGPWERVGSSVSDPGGTPLRMLSFQKLDVYQRAVEFLALTADISSDVPRGNAALLDQLRRASTSISLNIAEATGRTGSADPARTYAIARGSAMECAAVLDALKVLKVIEAPTHQRGIELLERIVAMLTRLCR
jgi:four helix bundle protein